MKRRNVLIFPAGTEIGLEIYNALKYCKEVRLFGAGQDVSNHAQFIYTPYSIIPSVHTSQWLEPLVSLCRTLNIEYIFPAHDDALVALSKHRSVIPATVICPSPEACSITRSKSATYKALSGLVHVPQLFRLDDTPESYNYPLLVKPDCGQGSLGITKVNDHVELLQAVAAVSQIGKPIVCEYLPGEEFTVDCFSDREQGLLFARARVRHRIRNGISVNTSSGELREAQEIATTINQALKLYGAWFFQLKRSRDDRLTLLEVAPRIAGAMVTHRVMGVNFPLLSIFEHERRPTKILLNQGRLEVDRALNNRFRHDIEFTSLYVDLDDTLICDGVVNTLVLSLIFESINLGRTVKLITRHRGDLREILNRHRITGLFDEIIHLKDREPKSDYIKESEAILVDDSFAERLEVSDRLGIPTFDCSMIEMLVHTRI